MTGRPSASPSPSPYASASPSPRRWPQHILLSISTTRTKRDLAWAPVLLGHDAEQTNDVEQSARLHCRAASDGAEPGAVRGLAVSASTFGDIQGNRDSGTAKLVRQGSLAAGQALSNAQGTGDEFDRALIHVQLLMVEHPRSFVGAGDAVAWHQGMLIQIRAQAPDGDERKVVATGLFVAGREPTTALEAVKQTLDAVTDPGKASCRVDARSPSWDARGSQPSSRERPPLLESRSASYPCVADERSAVGVFEQRGCDRRFVSLASRQFDVDRGGPGRPKGRGPSSRIHHVNDPSN